MISAPFARIDACWVCGGASLVPVHELLFDLEEYRRQDPELAAYSGKRLALRRCERCGFAQPESLPALPRYFDRMYDQRWSEDWIANEHASDSKDAIFADILAALAARLPPSRRRLLDVGAHAGRFVRLARDAGWDAEGLELNPSTANYARCASGVVIHDGNVHTFDAGAGRYDAVTLTDVLEHVPEPVAVLARARALLSDDGWIAVKVPNGPVQRWKERVRARVVRGYRPTLADNLVHVNHFSARALGLALERAGFDDVSMTVGRPELPARGAHALRLAAFRAARFAGGPRSPLAFNLQAYARRS